MNFLQLCQRTAQEAAVNGINPPTVAGQSAEPKRIVDWVNDALREILGDRNWSFLWEQATIVIPPGASSIATTIAPARWIKDQTYIPPVAPSNTVKELTYTRWNYFARQYRTMNQPDNLTAWTVRPDNLFQLNAISTAGVTISAERFKTPTLMVADADVPPMPEHYHMLIVWTALKKYAGYDEAGNQRQIAVDEMRTMLEAMTIECAPQEFTLDSGNLLDQYNA